MITLPPLGFGAAPIGNLYAPVEEEDALAAVAAAWDAGVRYFDTSPHYGLGLSERRLGAALATRPRNSYVVSTKVGRVLEPVSGDGDDLANGFAVPATHRRVWDFGADGVRRSLESSLDRLGLDRVDLALLHDVDLNPSQRDRAASEGLAALADLRDQGVVRAIGVGLNHWEMAEWFVRETVIDAVILAGRYTLLEQSAVASFLPLCEERGVAVVAAGVFNSGLLARPEVPDDATYDYAAAPPELIARARRIAAVCGRHGVSLPQAAIQFPSRHPAVVSVLVGARSAEEVRVNAEYAASPVPAGLWEDLRSEGLL
ncbi:D-threo-aldose 1-dehydrogenase [Saccharothrix tamanrassetensis]|uniref:D-threo-aldose 1-dehydrogenase n=1 Tax=Saccharothrix tamanrassetensis TaxID=1051531 RepID=A0A841CKU4_9PSEU|nr:aldo/keto reductase [Saccharothrix tamanrassetensis]MBB5956615.1 D-threo-aldose 1-dehydrogenase [Saccharothrix tamanrassetensis]